MSKNVLLMSAEIFKERSDVHDNIDPKLIYPIIKLVQDVYITPVLGTSLFNKIQGLVESNTIGAPANSDYKLLLDEYIIDAFVWYCKSELMVDISYQTWNKGVVRKQGEDTELPSMSDIFDLSSRYKNKGEFYANRLTNFLLDQSGRLQKYKEFINPGSTVDTITPEMRNYTSPIYLGDDGDGNPYCNRGGFNGQPYHD